MGMDAIAVSYKTRRMLADGVTKLPPGAAHYSYGSVKDKFLDCFTRFGRPIIEVERPEIYPYWRGAQKPVIHLQFKPFEEIRVLRGLYNVAHVAWEFERLPTFDAWPAGDERRTSPLNDYRHMLQLADEVWVGSQFTKDVLTRYGVDNVFVIPAPIASAVRYHDAIESGGPASGGDIFRSSAAVKLQDVRAIPLTRNNLRAMRSHDRELATVSLTEVLLRHHARFLMVANPGDLRKNLPAAMIAINQVPRAEKSCLILKLVLERHISASGRACFDILSNRFEELEYNIGDFSFDNAYAVLDYVTNDQLQSLYRAVEFYLCTSFAEGQNLPLLEAMAQGVVPVSVAHTAMLDYVNPDNGFVIESAMRTAPQKVQAAYGLPELKISTSDQAGVLAAIENALAAGAAERQAKRRLSVSAVRTGYSEDSVDERIEERLRAVSGSEARAA